jgi:hypothetical protein
MTDRIVLTIPRQEGYEQVAQLVLGGAAARQNVTFESLDDLEVAIAAVLERDGRDGPLTVELVVGDGTIRAAVGPFGADLERELERDEGEGGVGLRRVLDTVVDGYRVDERDDGRWLELEKRVGSAGGG